ncbi:MAG TPA: protoporphyrinogen oxidase HemJ [Gammaproteobacteria bacterium]|nr:protoporphyrinogen oxidase HemJ [Gammaproteobacteria bacterium]
MLWVKAFHVIFMVTWFAGLFYLPRLFVYHAMSEDAISHTRFVVMERKLFWGIMTPGAIITISLGLWLLLENWLVYVSAGWMHIKLIAVALLLVYHVWCGKLLRDFKHDCNVHSHLWYRWFNEIPVIFLIVIVSLAIVKPS